MNIDFHVHGLISKRKDFNEEFFLSEIDFAKENNIDAILLSEHFNAKDFYIIYEYLEKNYIYEGDRYLVNDVSIFPAIEVSVKNKGHVIISGDRDSIINIRKHLEAHMNKTSLIDFEDLLDLADVYDCLKIGAHPCRRGHKLCNQPKDLLKRLDALDLNGKDIFKKGEAIARDEIINLSKVLKLNVVSGSDSHTPIQLGSIITRLNKNCTTIKELRNCILSNDYSIDIKSSLKFKIFTSKVLKRYLISSNSYSKDTEFKL